MYGNLGNPPAGRLTFWVLAGTVGSSPVGEGRNPAVGDLLVSTLVYCSGYGPISFPFDPFLSAQSFSPGDWLGHLAMTHWGLWAMTATVLTCAPLMEITLNLVGPHPCGFNTRLVEFVATLADFRGALGSPVSIVRCANSEDCPVDPVSQRSLYCMLWDSPASGPVLRSELAYHAPFVSLGDTATYVKGHGFKVCCSCVSSSGDCVRGGCVNGPFRGFTV